MYYNIKYITKFSFLRFFEEKNVQFFSRPMPSASVSTVVEHCKGKWYTVWDMQGTLALNSDCCIVYLKKKVSNDFPRNLFVIILPSSYSFPNQSNSGTQICKVCKNYDKCIYQHTL